MRYPSNKSINLNQTFYSNGKLLITGEYLVLHGAKAFALPTKFGQTLTIQPATNQQITWTSHDHDNTIWFQATITFDSIKTNTQTTPDPKTNTLIQILNQAYLQNPNFIDNFEGYNITTNLTFPKSWGLGTSSTLINNIALWLQIDPYKLLQNTFGGSGYDIASAQNKTPIRYQLINGKPHTQTLNFNPEFANNLYFVYLNKKQSSKAAIEAFANKNNDIAHLIPIIDSITESTINAPNLTTFASQLQKHENLMSEILQIKTVHQTLFPDFPGTIKSLGAWGGDFILAISTINPTNYFEEKGYKTMIPYKDMIL